jgi:hypothetical protein
MNKKYFLALFGFVVLGAAGMAVMKVQPVAQTSVPVLSKAELQAEAKVQNPVLSAETAKGYAQSNTVTSTKFNFKPSLQKVDQIQYKTGSGKAKVYVLYEVPDTEGYLTAEVSFDDASDPSGRVNEAIKLFLEGQAQSMQISVKSIGLTNFDEKGKVGNIHAFSIQP